MDIIKCALQHFVGDFARLLHAVHNFMRKYSMIHRCPQIRSYRKTVCCFLNFLKLKPNEQPNLGTSTMQTKAQPNRKTARSAESIFAMKYLLKIKTHKCLFTTFLAISSQIVARKSRGLSTHRARVHDPRKNWVPYLKINEWYFIV